MQKNFFRYAIAIALAWATLAVLPAQGAYKDQSRIGDGEDEKKPPSTSPLFTPDDVSPPKTGEPRIDTPPKVEEPIHPEPYDINEIPALEKIELNVDLAKRAIDAFAFIGHRYDERGLIDYPTLEEFVEKSEAGKELLADVKKHGFDDITTWNTAIMNVSFAFGAVQENQTDDIRRQIESVKEDKGLSEEKKKRIIASLNALIPTKANIDVIRKLMELPEYKKKLNLLTAFE